MSAINLSIHNLILCILATTLTRTYMQQRWLFTICFSTCNTGCQCQ